VVNALQSRGLLRFDERSRMRSLWPVLAAAACSLGFVAGTLFSRGNRTSPASISQPEFAFLLHDNPRRPAAGGAEEVTVVREYIAWAQQQRAANHLVTGERLGEQAVELSGLQGQNLHAEHSSLGGYFLIKAQDMNAALAIARTCPHLKYGGSIEIRPIEDTSSR
jgi:hypothetical protein